MRRDTYTHGHHATVVANHAARTAQECAAFVLDRLVPGMRLLDLGCGPGSITTGLAAVVAPGQVVGCDVSDDVLTHARARAAEVGADNVTFEVASVYDLPYPDDSFDVAYAHQVLQHLTDPVAALASLRRVVRPDGLVAVRDADYATMIHAPIRPGIERWLELHHDVARRNGAEPDAGRHLLGWLRRAGFEEVTITTSTVTYADPAGREFWGGSWASRVTESAFAAQAVEYGVATPADLDAIAADFRDWAAQPDAFFAFLQGEAVAVVPASPRV